MIKSLHIENYALIEHLDIEMYKGFSVITGETGAGKSIILGAIELLRGCRADSHSIRRGAMRCVVEAVFDITDYGLNGWFDENELDFDGHECIVRREITQAGKSRAFINDTPVNLTLLKDIGEKLVDIHSQHKNLLLGKEDFQRSVLDIFAKNAELLNHHRSLYRQTQDARRQWETAVAEANRNRDEEDYLRFQFEQLDEAKLQEGEQEELEEEAAMLEHAEEIKQNLYVAQGQLQGSDNEGETDVLQGMRHAMSAIQTISDKMTAANELYERLNSCYIEVKDIANEVESLAEGVEYNPARLEQVNERLNTIYSLQQKHHVETVEELIALREQLKAQLDAIDNSDENVAELKKKWEELQGQTRKLATELSDRRKKAAAPLQKELEKSLQSLGMPNARITITVEHDEKFAGEDGSDAIQFLFSANKNGEPQNLSQVASGGEIARVMLSLKALIAKEVKLPTIIFDEIDTGVSGSIAEKMAIIMQQMGQSNRQVISITHLPQIAALGTEHYRVYKEDSDDDTTSHIVHLSNEERVKEIAHMLSGETITDAAIENARVLLKETPSNSPRGG